MRRTSRVFAGADARIVPRAEDPGKGFGRRGSELIRIPFCSGLLEAERAAARVLRGTALGAGGAAPRFVLVTLGENGSLLARRDPATGAVETRFAPLTGARVTAVDTTGAGDCFIGALAFFLARELAHGVPADCAAPAFFDALARCVPKASVVATASVTKRGTQTSYPHPADLPQDLFQ